MEWDRAILGRRNKSLVTAGLLIEIVMTQEGARELARRVQGYRSVGCGVARV